MRIKGKITQWDDAKGFGFIVPMLQGERVFLHIKALQNRTRRPVVGEVVTYSIGKDEQGRLQAQEVTFAGEKHRIKAAKTASNMPLLWLACFAGVLAGAVVLGKLPHFVAAAYALLSVFTFLSYWWDKRKAQSGNSSNRTPELHLQLLALLGGWPGAWLAQTYLRHKSQKQSFLAAFWFMVAVNLVALGWLTSQRLWF